MAYRVELAPPAERTIDRLDPTIRKRILRSLLKLEADPYATGAVKLAGAAQLYRVRVGDGRIVYDVLEDRLVVLVVKVGHRREVYR